MNTETPSKTLAETIRQHVTSLQRERAALVTQRDEVAAEIDAIQSAPVDRGDALQFCLDYIDSRAAAYLGTFDHMSKALDAVAWPRRYDVPTGAPGIEKGAPISLRDVDAGLSGDWQRITAHFAGGLRFFGNGTNGHHADEAAYFFFGDIIKAKVSEHFERLYPGATAQTEHAGLSIAERRERIAGLVEKRDALNADIIGIDAELTAIRTDVSGTTPVPPVGTQAAPSGTTRDRDIWHAVKRRGWHDEAGAWVSAGENAIAKRYGVSREHVDRIAALPTPPAA